MEQEETKTMAAAGAEMPPEVESWVQLHESELTELLQNGTEKTGKAGAEEREIPQHFYAYEMLP